MGITNLNKLIQEKTTKDSICEVKLDKYSGSRLAIDVNIYLHHFAYNPLVKQANAHIGGFFQMICDLLQHNITPIMIFDGKAPKEKADTIKNRQDIKLDNKNKVAILEKEIDLLVEDIKQLSEKTSVSVEEEADLKTLTKTLSEKQQQIEKLAKRDIKIKGSMYTELVQLFNFMGVPSLKAHGEADALCVKLFQEGFVKGVLSEDFDILPFGANLIRGIKEKRIETVTEYNLGKILTDLQWTQNQLVDLCILCGCDYSGKIQGIGPKTAFSLIQEYGTIEEAILKKISPGFKKAKDNTRLQELETNLAEFKLSFPKARELLLKSADQEVLPEIGTITLGSLDQKMLLPWLIEKCRYRPPTLEKKIELITKAYLSNNVNIFANSVIQDNKLVHSPKKIIISKKTTPKTLTTPTLKKPNIIKKL